jgi:hypothetical protein
MSLSRRMAFADELLVQHFYKAGGDEANRFYCCTRGGWEFLFMYAAARQKCRCRVKYQCANFAAATAAALGKVRHFISSRRKTAAA